MLSASGCWRLGMSGLTDLVRAELSTRRRQDLIFPCRTAHPSVEPRAARANVGTQI